MNRRELLESWQALAAAVAALAAFPTAVFWWRSSRPQEPPAGSWSDLGPPGGIEEGSWHRRTLSVERRNRWRLESRLETVYVRRNGDQLEVLSAVCPHTGCLVRREGAGFSCPCHRSLFDDEGRSVARRTAVAGHRQVLELLRPGTPNRCGIGAEFVRGLLSLVRPEEPEGAERNDGQCQGHEEMQSHSLLSGGHRLLVPQALCAVRLPV